MAITYRNLGQRLPNGNVLTDLHACPTDRYEVLSSIVVCNQSRERGTFRLSHAIGGAADSTEQYLYYDTPLDGGESYPITLGLLLAEGDVLRCMSSNGLMSFNVYGERGTA